MRLEKSPSRPARKRFGHLHYYKYGVGNMFGRANRKPVRTRLMFLTSILLVLFLALVSNFEAILRDSEEIQVPMNACVFCCWHDVLFADLL